MTDPTETTEDNERMTVLLQVQITPGMAARFAEMERIHGISRSSFTRLAIAERLEKYEAITP